MYFMLVLFDMVIVDVDGVVIWMGLFFVGFEDGEYILIF